MPGTRRIHKRHLFRSTEDKRPTGVATTAKICQVKHKRLKLRRTIVNNEDMEQQDK